MSYGSYVKTSSYFASITPMVSGGPKWQEIHNIHLLYNKTIVEICFGGHGVLLT